MTANPVIYGNSACAVALVSHGRFQRGFPAAGCRPRESRPREEPGTGCTRSSSSQLSIYHAARATASKFSSPPHSLSGGSVRFPPATGCQWLAARSEPDRSDLTPCTSTPCSGMSHLPPPWKGARWQHHLELTKRSEDRGEPTSAPRWTPCPPCTQRSFSRQCRQGFLQHGSFLCCPSPFLLTLPNVS